MAFRIQLCLFFWSQISIMRKKQPRMIVERTQTGKAVARQDPNFREGRPKKYTSCQLQHAMDLLNSGKSYKQVEAMTGISKSTLLRAKI